MPLRKIPWTTEHSDPHMLLLSLLETLIINALQGWFDFLSQLSMTFLLTANRISHCTCAVHFSSELLSSVIGMSGSCMQLHFFPFSFK